MVFDRAADGASSDKVAVNEEEIAAQHAALCTIKEQWASDFYKRKGRMPLFAITTYGCQMNERDSEHLRGMLYEAGFEEAAWDQADLLLFNTCCVRDHAEQRVFGNLGALQKRKNENPELIIGVCGCMMQQEETAKQLYKRFPFVDLVFGTHALYAFPEILSRALSTGVRVLDLRESEGRIAENIPTKRESKVSAFVTVMYGCDNFCSYCVVPYVRGRERSRRVGDILREIQDLVESGVREITLLGQNVNSYGLDWGQDIDGTGIDFSTLLRHIDAIEGLERLRFMTSHPKDLSAKLIEAMSDLKKVCKHIHLPVQSGSNSILKAMNRGYSREHYLSLLRELRKRVPGIEITTDIIVGFPGETDADFEETLALVREAEFSAAFTFMYSPRNGTPAAKMQEQVPPAIKKERLLRLNDLQAQLGQKNNEKYIGQTLEVLVEGCDERDPPQLFGKTSSFKMIYFPGDKENLGKFLSLRVTGCRANALSGEAIMSADCK